MVTIDPDYDNLRDLRPEDVDRRLAIAVRWRDYDRGLQREMLEMLAETAREEFPAGPSIRVRVGPYHVGPMASGLTVQMLFTAYEDIRPIATDVAVWITIGQFAIKACNRARSLLRRYIEQQGAVVEPYANVFLDDHIVISQPLVQGLCVEHYMRTHRNPRQRFSIDVSARSPYPEMSWEGRPDESVVYTVRIWTGQTSYVYVVDAEGKPIEHFLSRGSHFASLPLPDWYEEL